MALTAQELAEKLMEVGKPHATVVFLDNCTPDHNYTIEDVEQGDDPSEVWLTGELFR